MTIGCLILISCLLVASSLLALFVANEDKSWQTGAVVFACSLIASFIIFIAVLGANIAYHKDVAAPSKIITIDESAYVIDDQGYRKVVHLRNIKNGSIINSVIVSSNRELELFNNRNFLIQETYTTDMLGNDVFLGYRMIEKSKLEK